VPFIIELIIVYAVLFFPSLSAGYFSVQSFAGEPFTLEFSAVEELLRVVTFDLPGFALIWYLLAGRARLEAGAVAPAAAAPVPNFRATARYLWQRRPRKSDFRAAFGILLQICLCGLLVAIAAMILYKESQPEMPPLAFSALTLFLVILSSLSTGYMEEAFFRVYLFKRLTQAGITMRSIIVVSVALFAVCHFYEGALGLLHAALAGLVLSHAAYRGKTLHSLALAHASWNTIVWLTAMLGA
jgi:membrane protease YdiL (CAAX protease family)